MSKARKLLNTIIEKVPSAALEFTKEELASIFKKAGVLDKKDSIKAIAVSGVGNLIVKRKD